MCIIFHLSPSCSPHASLRQRRQLDMPPREETFRAPRDGVSAPERRPFGSQKAAFYKPEGIILIFIMLQTPSQSPFSDIRTRAAGIVFGLPAVF